MVSKQFTRLHSWHLMSEMGNRNLAFVLRTEDVGRWCTLLYYKLHENKGLNRHEMAYWEMGVTANEASDEPAKRAWDVRHNERKTSTYKHLRKHTPPWRRRLDCKRDRNFVMRQTRTFSLIEETWGSWKVKPLENTNGRL